MNDDFKIYLDMCILFVYSLAGEIFLFKIVKMNLTNLRQKKSPKLLVQSKDNYISIFALLPNTFQSDQSKMAANNMSNVHGSPDLLSSLLLLQLVTYT